MKPETLSGLERIMADFEQFAAIVRQETAATISLQDHVALIKHFADLRRLAERAKTVREALYELEDSLSKAAIPDLFVHIRNTTGQKPPFYIEGVGRVSVSHKWSASILDKPAGFSWLREHQAGDLIQETVNAQSLASYAKRKIEEDGVDLPPEIFKVGTTPYTSITKS